MRVSDERGISSRTARTRDVATRCSVSVTFFDPGGRRHHTLNTEAYQRLHCDTRLRLFGLRFAPLCLAPTVMQSSVSVGIYKKKSRAH